MAAGPIVCRVRRKRMAQRCAVKIEHVVCRLPSLSLVRRLFPEFAAQTGRTRVGVINRII